MKEKIATEREQADQDLINIAQKIANEKDEYYAEVIKQEKHDAYWTGATQGAAVTATVLASAAFLITLLKIP